MFSHTTILDHMKGLSCKPIPDGICFGFTTGWIMYELSEEGDNFLELFSQASSTQDLLARSLEIQKAQEQKQSLTEYGNHLKKILDLMEDVLIFQEPWLYKNILGKVYPQFRIEEVANLRATKAVKSQGGIIKIYSAPIIKNKTELSDYFKSISQIIENEYKRIGPFPVVFHVGSHNHSIGLRYIATRKQWKFVNINRGKVEFFHPDELSDTVFASFHDKDYCALNVDCYMTNNNYKPSKFYQTDIKEAFDEFKRAQVIDATVAERVTSHGISICYIAARFGHVDVLQRIHQHKPNFDPQLIFTAIYNNQPDVISALSKYYYNFRFRDREGNFLQHHAAQHGFVEVIKVLQNLGLSFNIKRSDGITPAHIIAQEGHFHLIELFSTTHVDLTVCDNNGWTPAHHASSKGDENFLEALAQSKINIGFHSQSEEDPIHIAARMGHSHLFPVFVRCGVNINQTSRLGHSPLSIAVQHNSGHTVKALYALKADMNRVFDQGESLIHLAVKHNALSVLDVFRQLRLNFNVHDRLGMTPLHWAALLSKLSMIKVLVQGGACMDSRDSKGMTVLDICVEADAIGVMKQLMECGVNVNLQNRIGATVSHRALAYDKVDMLKLLAKYKANFNQTNDDGQSPLMIAVQKSKWEIVCIMLLSIDPHLVLDPAVLTIINKYRHELMSALINLLSNIANADERTVAVLGIINSANLLGKILNTPTNAVKFFFTTHKYKDRNITESISRLVSHFKSDLAATEVINEVKSDLVLR